MKMNLIGLIVLAVSIALSPSLVVAQCIGAESSDYQVGNEYFQKEVRRHVLRDPELTGYVRELAYQALAATGEVHCEYNFVVLRDRTVNAFALPGGFVAVNLGLLQESRSEAELVGVFSHEIGHTNERHGMGKKSNTAVFALNLAETLMNNGRSRRTRSARTRGIYTTGVLGTYALLAKWSRDHERESDEVAIRALQALGYDLNAFAQFFERLPSGSMLGLEKVFGSHPSPKSRAEKIREAASRSSLTEAARGDSETFQAMKKHRLVAQGIAQRTRRTR